MSTPVKTAGASQEPVPGEPIAATDAYRAAVRAAAATCQCKAGECGRHHARTGGVCNQRMTGLSSVCLYAIPTGGGGLMVVCEPCFDGRRRIAAREAALEAEDRLELFALPGLGLDDLGAP